MSVHTSFSWKSVEKSVHTTNKENKKTRYWDI